MKKFFDYTLLRYILVGIVNTLFGTTIMFLFYNLLHFGYWVSSASNYIFGSTLSFFLNKHFTFRNKSRSPKTVLKFIVNILLCYLVAYGIAKPAVRFLLSGADLVIQDNAAMFTGMIVFIGLNYLGQRFFAFREDDASGHE